MVSGRAGSSHVIWADGELAGGFPRLGISAWKAQHWKPLLRSLYKNKYPTLSLRIFSKSH